MMPELSITVQPILDKLLDQFDIKVLYIPDFHVPKTKMKRIFLCTWHGEMEGDVHLGVRVDLTLVLAAISCCGVQQVQAPCVPRVLQLWILWFNWKLPNEVSLHSKVTTIGKSLWDSICVSYYFVHSINRWHLLTIPAPTLDTVQSFIRVGPHLDTPPLVWAEDLSAWADDHWWPRPLSRLLPHLLSRFLPRPMLGILWAVDPAYLDRTMWMISLF